MKAQTKIIAASVAMLLSTLALPLVADAATADTTISSVVSPTITLSTSGTVNLDVTPTASGVQTTDKDIVSVSTNDTNGYTLSLTTKTTNVNLVSGANTIIPTTGTAASPIALTAGKWGFRVDSLSGFGAGPTSTVSNAAIGATTFAGVPASNGTAVTLKSTSTTASADTTNVWYSVAANSTQPSGTYTQLVTYTAVTK